jgi:hypothetical protein
MPLTLHHRAQPGRGWPGHIRVCTVAEAAWLSTPE